MFALILVEAGGCGHSFWYNEEPVIIRYIPSEVEVQTEFTQQFFWFNPYDGVCDDWLPKEDGFAFWYHR